MIHIHQGKGGQDRDVMLSPILLDELRQYFRRMSPKPKNLFVSPGGGRAHATGYPHERQERLSRRPPPPGGPA